MYYKKFMAVINTGEVRLSVTSNPSLIFVGKASVHPGGGTNIKRVDSDERCKFDPIKLYNPGPTWGVVQILIRGFFQRKKEHLTWKDWIMPSNLPVL
jgi:hypothetical protein